MKKLFIILLSIFCLGEVNAQKVAGQFTIKGNIAGMTSGKVKLVNIPPLNTEVDSAIVKEGKFVLKGRVDMPTQFFIIFDEVQPSGKEFIPMIRLFVEPGEIIYNADITKRGSAEFINAKIHNEINEYAVRLKKNDHCVKARKLTYKISDAFKAGDMDLVKTLDTERSILNMKVINEMMQWKTDARSNHAIAYHVVSLSDMMSLEEKEIVEKMFDKNFKTSTSLNGLRNFIASEKKITIGQKAPDFEVKDLNGKSYSLKDFKGKYIFLEFSASWCGWCKKEIPYVRKAYHALKEKNIVFITMNMDTTRAKWENDVKEENIEWYCFSNLEGMTGNLAKSYNLSGIPACFVISPDGKIIERDLRGDRVLTELSKLL